MKYYPAPFYTGPGGMSKVKPKPPKKKEKKRRKEIIARRRSVP
jgi:hypothetical protein